MDWKYGAADSSLIRFRETIRGFVKKKIEIDENRRLGTSATGASSLLLVGDEDKNRDRRSIHVAMRRSFAVRYNHPSVLNMLRSHESLEESDGS